MILLLPFLRRIFSFIETLEFWQRSQHLDPDFGIFLLNSALSVFFTLPSKERSPSQYQYF